MGSFLTKRIKIEIRLSERKEKLCLKRRENPPYLAEQRIFLDLTQWAAF